MDNVYLPQYDALSTLLRRNAVVKERQRAENSITSHPTPAKEPHILLTAQLHPVFCLKSNRRRNGPVGSCPGAPTCLSRKGCHRYAGPPALPVGLLRPEGSLLVVQARRIIAESNRRSARRQA